MNPKRWTLLLCFFLLFSLTLGACGREDEEPTPELDLTPIGTVLTQTPLNTEVKIEGMVYLVTDAGFYIAECALGLIFVELAASEEKPAVGDGVEVVGTYRRDLDQPKIVHVESWTLSDPGLVALEPVSMSFEDVRALNRRAATGSWYRLIEVVGLVQPHADVYHLIDLEGEKLFFDEASSFDALSDHVGHYVKLELVVTAYEDGEWRVTFAEEAHAITPEPVDAGLVEQTLHGFFSGYLVGEMHEGNMHLPTKHPIVDGDITWMSSDEEIIDNEGIVTYGERHHFLTMTAQAKVGGETFAFHYHVTVYGDIYETASQEDFRLLDDYYEEIYRIADMYPEIVKLHHIGDSYWGLPIYALEIADNPGQRDGRPESYHQGGIHATEWPSSEIAIELAWYLVQNYRIDERVTDILETTRVFIAPNVNPDGYYMSRHMDVATRKNVSPNPDGSTGTNLNNNFSYHWAGRGVPDPSNWRGYYGPSAYSEVETQAIGDFFLSRDFITIVDGHTYLEVYFLPPYIDDDAHIFEPFFEALHAYTSYEIRTGTGGGSGSTYLFGYGVLRALTYIPEYFKISQPDYTEGFSAPGLQTDAFGMIEGNLIWPSMGTRDHHTTHAANGELVDAGTGESMPAHVSGNIALIKRSDDISHADQIDNAVAAGAVGVVLYNDEKYWMRGPLVPDQPDIGVMAIRGDDGQQLAAYLALGNTMSVSIVPDQFKQDTFAQLWERHFEPTLITLERAADFAARVQGEVRDALSGQPVKARMEKGLTAVAPFAGIHEGGYMLHERHSYIDVNGDYTWYMTPSKQPFLKTDPYAFVVTAPNYHSRTMFLEIDHYQEEHTLDFALQPVVEFADDTLRSALVLNRVFPLEFVTVDDRGVPVEVTDITLVLEMGGDGNGETVVLTPGDGLEDFGNGRFGLDLDTTGWSAGEVLLRIDYDVDEQSFDYVETIELVEGLTVEGETLLSIPSSGSESFAYDALAWDAHGDEIALNNLVWSLQTSHHGVSIDPDGTLVVSHVAQPGHVIIEVSDGALQGRLRVRIAGHGDVSEIVQAEAMIDALPAVISEADADAIEQARIAVDGLAVDETFVRNVTRLIRAEGKLQGLSNRASHIEAVVERTEAAIEAIPDPIGLIDRQALFIAQDWSERVVSMGGARESIANVAALDDALTTYDTLVDDYFSALSDALDALPEVITDEHDAEIADIRETLDEGFSLGLDETLLHVYEEKVIAAEEALHKHYAENYERESLFVLGDPGPDNRNSTWLTAFDNEARWASDYGPRTVAGQSFEPLKFFSVAFINLHENPRFMQFDISERPYEYVEGWLGISDAESQTIHPLDFTIYGDGEVLFEATLEHAAPAIFYRLDVSDVTWLRFEYEATDTVSLGGYANRIVFVEPRFLIEINQEMKEATQAAIEAIDALPAYISLLDQETVEAARTAVDDALSLGVSGESIDNLADLEDAEQLLEQYIEEAYDLEDLFNVAPPVIEEVGMSRFIDYDDDAAWSTHRSIGGVYYAPTPMYTLSMNMDSIPTRYVVYDVSALDFDEFTGDVGITDQDSHTDHTLNFNIYVDDVLVFSALLDRYEPAKTYRIDLEGAQTLKIEYTANSTSAGGYANRIAVVRPVFARFDEAGLITTAFDSIAALPDVISLADYHDIRNARRHVDNALAWGIDLADIENYDHLLSAEATLDSIWDREAAIQEAIDAIDAIGEEVDFTDRLALRVARLRLNEALNLNADLGDIPNYERLTDAETVLESLVNDTVERTSMFEADFTVIRNDLHGYLDEDDDAWSSEATIAHEHFDFDLFEWDGTLLEAKELEIDLTHTEYSFVRGFIGISDDSAHGDYPLTLTFEVDGETVMSFTMDKGHPGMPYLLDIHDAQTLTLHIEADTTDAEGHANTLALSALEFLTPDEAFLVQRFDDVIESIPTPATPFDETLVLEARRLAHELKSYHLEPSALPTYGRLTDAEDDLAYWKGLEGYVTYDILIAKEAVQRLPDDITLADKACVIEADRLVDVALRRGAMPFVFDNVEDKLTDAWDTVHALFRAQTSITELSELTPSNWLDGPLNEMSTRFAAYGDSESWDTGRSIFTRTYGDRKVYSRGHQSLDLQEQWIEYDISTRGFDYLEGYIGIIDESSAASFPPRFIIYGKVDGEWEVLLEIEELWRGEPAYYFLLDVSDVTHIRFYLDAEVVSGNNWVNRIALVEPWFYTLDE